MHKNKIKSKSKHPKKSSNKWPNFLVFSLRALGRGNQMFSFLYFIKFQGLPWLYMDIPIYLLHELWVWNRRVTKNFEFSAAMSQNSTFQGGKTSSFPLKWGELPIPFTPTPLVRLLVGKKLQSCTKTVEKWSTKNSKNLRNMLFKFSVESNLAKILEGTKISQLNLAKHFASLRWRGLARLTYDLFGLCSFVCFLISDCKWNVS